MCLPQAVLPSLPETPLSRRAAIGAAIAAGVAGVGFASPVSAAPATRARRSIPATHFVDLTHPLSPEFPYIPVPGLTHEFRAAPIATMAQHGVYALKWELIEHIGTHIDAPSHFVAGQPNLEGLAVDDFVVPIAVVDVLERARRDHDYALTPDDLLAWERRHGRLPKNAAVFMRSGWDKFVDAPAEFLGTDSSGTLHFPGFAPDTCEFLLRERQISGIGVETISIDIGPDRQYKAHKALFAGGKWAIENIANLERVPPSGATAIIGAIPVVMASGSPIRLFAGFD